jgi:hypothetical protein
MAQHCIDAERHGVTRRPQRVLQLAQFASVLRIYGAARDASVYCLTVADDNPRASGRWSRGAEGFQCILRDFTDPSKIAPAGAWCTSFVHLP